jgi:hypothetical protein
MVKSVERAVPDWGEIDREPIIGSKLRLIKNEDVAGTKKRGS